MNSKFVQIANLVVAFAVVSIYGETLRATPDLGVHGPLVYDPEFDKWMANEVSLDYAGGAVISQVDTSILGYYRQSHLNASLINMTQAAGYYNYYQTRISLGEISLGRYYDSIGGNPFYSTYIGDGLYTTSNITALGVINGGSISSGRIIADTIQAYMVVSTPKWQVPDYVFDPDYKRKSLGEIESFVKQNRHLPDVPSAREIEERGMNLADMNLRLLKNLEELTLHVIDLEKSLAEQRERSDKLQGTLERLTQAQK